MHCMDICESKGLGETIDYSALHGHPAERATHDGHIEDLNTEAKNEQMKPTLQSPKQARMGVLLSSALCRVWHTRGEGRQRGQTRSSKRAGGRASVTS